MNVLLFYKYNMEIYIKYKLLLNGKKLIKVFKIKNKINLILDDGDNIKKMI